MTELVVKTTETLWSSLVAFAEQIAASYKQQRLVRMERAQIVRELSYCTDRELADMGFSRSDIPDIANGTYAR